METASLSDSSDSGVLSPTLCRPGKRRRVNECSDGLPSSTSRVYSSQGIWEGYDQAISQTGFFTTQEQNRDVHRTEFHLSKAEAFAERLTVAIKPRWRNRRLPYTNVCSLLLLWQEDDLGVETEIKDLNDVLKETYQYQTEIWAIPPEDSHFHLTSKVHSFVKENDDEGKLLILYYGGHAYKKGNSQPIWSSRSDHRKTKVTSDAVFAKLEHVNADVLLLFDSCQAVPEPFESEGKGIVSCLASTGFEPSLLGVAPIPGLHSFTRSLINELCDASHPKWPACSPEELSDVSLHSKIMERLMLYKPEPLKRSNGSYMRDEDNNHIIEPYRRRTPIYRCLTRNRTPYPIRLAPLSESLLTPSNSVQSSAEETFEDQVRDPPSPTGEKAICVLISVRLTPHALDEPDIDSWVNMLQSLPSAAEDVRIDASEITIENYYRSCSGLMIVKMPLDIWGWMPKHPAMTLIGCVSGDNQAKSLNKRIQSHMRDHLVPWQANPQELDGEKFDQPHQLPEEGLGIRESSNRSNEGLQCSSEQCLLDEGYDPEIYDVGIMTRRSQGHQMPNIPRRKLPNTSYTIGWICATSTEYVAAQAFVDEMHKSSGDTFSNKDNYTLGRIGQHNVVIAFPPDGNHDFSSVATIVKEILQSFPNIGFSLMVGVGGGAPNEKYDIRLGDVVVGAPRDGGVGGLLPYDFTKTMEARNLHTTGPLIQPPIFIQSAVNQLSVQYNLKGVQFDASINGIFRKKPGLLKEYKRPDRITDRLYNSGVAHPRDNEAGCSEVCGDNPSSLALRRSRATEENLPAIHYGVIASANQLIRDATVRDKLTAENDIICFEMEAVGLMNLYSSLTIRGICNYSDTHGNKEWQGYAAMVAAVYARDLLHTMAPNSAEAEMRIYDTTSAVTDFQRLTSAQMSNTQRQVGVQEEIDKRTWLGTPYKSSTEHQGGPDPSILIASILAVIISASQSIKSLHETVKRFNDRSKTLRRLQDELEDLINILSSLREAISPEMSVLALLKAPLERCGQVCRQFEQSMKVFGGKSRRGFRDWAKMEFMRGDINEFIDTISAYKSTISVGLGTITMHTSKVSLQVLRQYHEMIQDTAYNLELRLQRIDERKEQITTENPHTPGLSQNLEDEKALIKNCFRICEDVRSDVKSLTSEEAFVPKEAKENATANTIQTRPKRKDLDGNQDSFTEISHRLKERLETMVLNENTDNNERIWLHEDINIAKQCLEVCKVAREWNPENIHQAGMVMTDNDNDQVVVTTLTDLFDVRKAMHEFHSAQLIGSMTDDTLLELAKRRYHSRFGSLLDGRDGTAVPPPYETEDIRRKPFPL